jgi:hypothetical protein
MRLGAVEELRGLTSLTLIDEADSVPAIKLQSTKECLNFIVLTAARCKVVVMHTSHELFNCSFCEVTYTIGSDASERQVNTASFTIKNRHPTISVFLTRLWCNLCKIKLATECRSAH